MHHFFVNGAKIPSIGFGTYGMTRPEMLRMIPAALKSGFRHVDTAQIYRNETEVGECIPRSTRKAGLSVTAYCAMAIGRVLLDPMLAEIAEDHGRTIPQVVLRWLIQQGNIVALSRTTNPGRVVENLAVFDFELGEHEMVAIRTLARPNSRIVNPHELAPVWDP